CGKATHTDNSGSGGPGKHTLTIHLSGQGTVQSASPAFTCTADCQQTLDAGASVHLVASPAADFVGWQGACSGTGTCDISMSADQDVRATFTGAGHAFTVDFTGNGSGHITSTPAGIDCPGTCFMTVDAGTSVSLTEKADPQSVFVGWGGACSGNGTCVFTVSTDTKVYANFSAVPPPPPPPPPPQCAHLAPDAVPMLQYVARPVRGVTCLSPVGDANGTLAFPMSYSASDYHGSLLDFVAGGGAFLREDYFESEGPNVIQQPSGLTSAGGNPH